MTGLQAPLAQHSSDAAGIADLLAGKVKTHFAGAGAVTEHIRSGKLRALGVTTLTRFELLPDVPPIADGENDFLKSARLLNEPNRKAPGPGCVQPGASQPASRLSNQTGR
jgi:tripartite-type tricarboxylate transporter receptor subunit TctC